MNQTDPEATNRMPVWRDPFSPVAWRLWAVLVVLAIAVPFSCATAHAVEVTADGVVFSAPECASFAELIEQVGDARDAGIAPRHYVAFLQIRFVRAAGGQERVKEALLFEVRRAFSSALEAERLKVDAYTRCISGPLGERPRS